jgi:type IV pilus assembly protein PilB
VRLLAGFLKKRLGDILVESGLITGEQLKDVLAAQKESGKKLGEVVVEQGYATRKSIIEVLEFQLGIPYVNLAISHIEPSVVRLIPENMALKHEIIPIRLENNTVTVAASDPLNATAFDDVRIYTGHEVYPVMADGEQIRSLISRHFGSQKAIEAAEEFSRANSLFLKDQALVVADSDSSQEVGESPAVKLINILIEQAVQGSASDIHIEPQQRNVRIRFRIDGQLQDVMQADIDILPAIVSRIKVIAGMNIAEKRLPQDGRITYRMSANEVDLRISVLPTIFGEKVVIRVINKDTYNVPKDKLGFLPENLAVFEEIMKNPHGVILVTGPTGSGKTTTLYTAIKDLNKANVNIVTVEDPVESAIRGISQVQVNPKAGLSFANSLRSILRQDPDIILIGEIRDAETAEIAIRAAITGHLVLSTLHTNDVASSVIRLVDMGIQPFLVSTSVVGVIAQRLVRRICKNCKTAYTPSEEELVLFDAKSEAASVLYRGKGCEMCKGTGYKGRTAIHEVMKIGSELRQAIYKGESADTLKEIAVRSGMITLRENCRKLVLEGVTTLEEMVKVAYAQE